MVKNNLGKRFDTIDTEVSRAIKNPPSHSGGGSFLRVASTYTELVIFFGEEALFNRERAAWNAD